MGFSSRELERLDDAIESLLETLENVQRPEEVETWQEEWSLRTTPAFVKELHKRARIAIYLHTRSPRRTTADQLTEFLSHGGTTVRKLLQWKLPSLSEGDVDDAVAEAIARIWSSRAKYNSGQPLFPLIYVVAKRVALDGLRKHKREQLFRQRLSVGLASEGDSDESDAHSTQLVMDVRRVVQKLPGLDQKVLHAAVMFPQSDHWAKDLAEQLGDGVRPGMLRVRRIRAIDKLRATLREKGHEIPGATP